MIDLRQLLKRYNSFIYTGDQVVDLDLMTTEVKNLYDNNLITIQEYQTAMVIIRRRLREIDV